MEKGNFQPSGIITLTTDFGLQDPYVGSMQGVILRFNPAARIVDLCHALSAHSIEEASFFLRGSWKYFPPGTIHVVVVDPGVGTDRKILAAMLNGHIFIAPDNGVLTEVLTDSAEVRCLQIDEFLLPSPGRTFHGRDIMAPAAGRLSKGFHFAGCGPHFDAWHRKPLPRPNVTKESAVGEVLVIDRFGNMITNITDRDLHSIGVDRGNACIEVTGHIIEGMSETYHDGNPGIPMALIGSYGHLEIAIPMENAAETMNLKVGSKLTVSRSEKV